MQQPVLCRLQAGQARLLDIRIPFPLSISLLECIGASRCRQGDFGSPNHVHRHCMMQAASPTTFYMQDCKHASEMHYGDASAQPKKTYHVFMDCAAAV